MPESYSNETTDSNQIRKEVFSQLQAPLDTPFFVRLDGRRFQKTAEKLRAEKPFDHTIAKCLVSTARTLYQNSLNPTLIYVASDELNMLFAYAAPFNRRVEKTDSILAGIASSAFALQALKSFRKSTITSFDSRIAVTTQDKVVDYLIWRQQDAWRNHNNAYAYWMLRKLGHKPAKIANMLKGWKSPKLHEFLLQQGIDPAKTPPWQRRGILIYKQPYQKISKKEPVITVTRRRTTENWNLPIFSSTEGKILIHRILQWAKPHKA